MPTAYISTPFGSKIDPVTGREIDFDLVYSELIRPAVEAAGMKSTRADELIGSNFHLATLKEVLGADLMIADLTMGNANVAYEIGIRHAVRGETLLISEEASELPFSFSYIPSIPYSYYDLDATRDVLTNRIIGVLNHASTGSPLYEFFPDLSVRLPAGLRHRSDNLNRSQLVEELKDDATIEQARTAEGQLDVTDKDPALLLKIMSIYSWRDSWDDIVRLSLSLPEELVLDTRVVVQVARALTRRNGEGDRERAVELLTRSLRQNGENPDVLSMLGLVLKAQYRDEGDEDVRKAAIDAYLRAFEVSNNEIYAGVNAVALLAQAGDEDRLNQLLPVVRWSFQRALEAGGRDYWMVVTGLELAAYARDWSAARDLAGLAVDLAGSRWELQSTADSIRTVQSTLHDPDDRHELDAIQVLLHSAAERL